MACTLHQKVYYIQGTLLSYDKKEWMQNLNENINSDVKEI